MAKVGRVEGLLRRRAPAASPSGCSPGWGASATTRWSRPRRGRGRRARLGPVQRASRSAAAPRVDPNAPLTARERAGAARATTAIAVDAGRAAELASARRRGQRPTASAGALRRPRRWRASRSASRSPRTTAPRRTHRAFGDSSCGAVEPADADRHHDRGAVELIAQGRDLLPPRVAVHASIDSPRCGTVTCRASVSAPGGRNLVRMQRIRKIGVTRWLSSRGRARSPSAAPRRCPRRW